MKRPRLVSLLAVLIFLIGIWNGFRMVEAALFWKVLAEYHLNPGPLYVSTSGGFWLLAALFLTYGLWLGKSWSWWASIGASLAYALWYWTDRLLLQVPHANWPFALAVTLIVLAVISLALFSPATLRFLKRKDRGKADLEGRPSAG